MILKRYLLLISLILVMTIGLASCSFDPPSPTPIKHGFSKDLVALLKKQYEIEIPDSAVFVNGFYDNGYQEDAIDITFKIPSNLKGSICSSHWKIGDIGSIDIGHKGYEQIMEYERMSYTYLCFYPAKKDGTVEVYFLGRWPEKHIT